MDIFGFNFKQQSNVNYIQGRHTIVAPSNKMTLHDIAEQIIEIVIGNKTLFVILQQLYPQCPKNDFKDRKTAILKRLNLIRHFFDSYIQSYGLMIRSTVKAANRKSISFMPSENITFIYRVFQV